MSEFFSAKQREMNHHLTTKTAVSVLEAKTKCITCEKDFLSFYSLQKHQKFEHGKFSRIQDLTVDLEPIMGDYHDQELCEELTTCQHFLDDSEFVRGKQHVFIFASTNPCFLKKKLQHVFENSLCAAKVNLAHGFVLRNVEDGKYRYFYALENSLILERSQLIAKKEDMLELQNILDDINVVELSTRERSSTKWNFLFATNVTLFAALRKSVPVGFKDVLLPPRLLKHIDVNCLTRQTRNATTTIFVC